jgi:hypothetical protein
VFDADPAVNRIGNDTAHCCRVHAMWK